MKITHSAKIGSDMQFGRKKLVKQIGIKIQDATGEKLSTFYLFQSISIAVQKGKDKD